MAIYSDDKFLTEAQLTENKFPTWSI